jgi:hypothetical protein
MPNAIKHVQRAPKHGTRVRSALATIWYCPFCNDPAGRVRVPRGVRMGGKGRGHGWRTTSLARSQVARHIKDKHPEQLT